MLPITELQGKKLGEKHKSFNTLVRDALEHGDSFRMYMDAEEMSPIDRRFKIDLAAERRDVDYILATLKCDDMFYVSRALRATWLITDNEYAHIINPDYVYTTLHPLMYSKAFNKLIFNIHQHLRSEERCQIFYEYHSVLKNTVEALHFLPYCSRNFIDNVLNDNSYDWKGRISSKLVKLICERFPDFAALMIGYVESHCVSRLIEDLKFMAIKHTALYFNLLEEFREHSSDSTFSSGFSKLIVNKYPEKLMEDYDVYLCRLHLEHLPKYWSEDKIIELIHLVCEDSDMNWHFERDHLKKIVNKMTPEKQDEILDKYRSEQEIERPEKLYLYKGRRGIYKVDQWNLYRWYRNLPFDTAFKEIKKILREASDADDRCTLLKVLLTLAGDDETNLHQLLLHYQRNHINEVKHYKLLFLNALTDDKEVYRFSERCWKTLNDLFHSVEVYGDGNYFNYNRNIVYYHILHDSPVPDTIMEKYLQKDLNKVNRANNILTKVEKYKIANYFNNLYQMKCDSAYKENGIDNTLIGLTKRYVEHILKWSGNLADHPNLIEMIKVIVKARPGSLTYPKGKDARRQLFSESILMSQDNEVILNILRHDPSLLENLPEIIEQVIKTKKVIHYRRVFQKIRMYFYDLEIDLRKIFKGKLTKCEETSENVGNITRCMSLLCPKNEFLDTILKYKPTNHKIEWSEEDILLVNIRKGIAQNLHHVRPILDLKVVYEFAKGDYLQFTVPSLLSICTTLPLHLFVQQMPDLLNSPVSAQKHGIRLAFAKLKSEEIHLENMWSKARNVKIRCVIFEKTFNVLKDSKDKDEIQRLWNIMKKFVNTLQEEEDRNIFVKTFTRLHCLPESIRYEACKVFYKALKGVSDKIDLSDVRYQLIDNMAEWISKGINTNFVAKVLVENLSLFLEEDYEYDYQFTNSLLNLFIKYLVTSTDDDDQEERYEKVAKPMFTMIIKNWNFVIRNGKKWGMRTIFCEIVERFGKESRTYLDGNEYDQTLRYVYEKMLQEFENVCNVQNNFDLFLRINFLIIFDEAVNEAHETEDCYKRCGKHFAKKCAELLTNLLENHHIQTITPLFGPAMKQFLLKDLGIESCERSLIICFYASILDNLVNEQRSLAENIVGLHFLEVKISDRISDESKAYYKSVISRIRRIQNSEIQFHLNLKCGGTDVSMYEYAEIKNCIQEEYIETEEPSKVNKRKTYCTLL